MRTTLPLPSATKDPDTVADVGNLLGDGDLLVGLDVPKVSDLYVEVGTPNAGIPVVDQTFSETLTFRDLDEINRYGHEGHYHKLVQDSGAGGHFNGRVNPVSIGPGHTNQYVIKGFRSQLAEQSEQLWLLQATGQDQWR